MQTDDQTGRGAIVTPATTAALLKIWRSYGGYGIDAQIVDHLTHYQQQAAAQATEIAMLRAALIEAAALLKHVHVLDCGAHHCRYCPAKSPDWQHSPGCPYEESQRAHTAAGDMRKRLAALTGDAGPQSSVQCGEAYLFPDGRLMARCSKPAGHAAAHWGEHASGSVQWPRSAGDAGPPARTCETCCGSGWVATKRFVEDGFGEVDGCPTCDPDRAGRGEAPQG